MGMTSLVAQMVKCQPTMQEKSESESEIAQSCPTLCDPMDYIVHGILQATEYWSGQLFPSPGDLLNPRNEPESPALAGRFSTTEPQEKPKNTGVGSLSLLQWLFLTQESNQVLLHCRWILYQLSY